jgi:hypothetical protein
MAATAKTRCAELLALARTDPNILAFWLDGSRGKGLQNQHSDYDCTLLVAEEVFEAYQARHAGVGQMGVDLSVTTLDRFRAEAAWGSAEAWRRYNYARLVPLVDKTGLVQGLFDEKSRVPAEHVQAFVAASLDGFVNQVYRALKCDRDGALEAARLEAAEGVPRLLDALFALHGGRLRPYHKYLEWELAEYPLERLPWAPTRLLEMLLQVLASADVAVQQEWLREAERLFRGEGYGAVFDAWGEALRWMLAYRGAD